MKATTKINLLIIFLTLGTLLQPQKATAQVSVNFQVFYDDLSPYGNWVDNSNYGYVWIPEVSNGFTPYNTNGHWVYTDAGWTWVSNYSWGWAPFHYGRWYNDSFYGWVWVPDTEWGPGWVTWRSSNDYYGWAPIGPGIDIQIAYSNGYNVPYNQWTFVPTRNFGSTNINNYYVNNSNNVTIINNTTVINNIRKDKKHNVNYNSGPDRNDVQKRTGRNYNEVTINDRKSRGQKVGKNEMQLYRPEVSRNNASEKKPVPSKVTDLSSIKSESERNSKAKAEKDQNVKQQQNNQKAKQQQDQQQKNNQKAKQQQDQQVKQQQEQQQRNNQQAKQQQDQQQRNNQQAKQQQEQQQRNNQQAKQQQEQQQRNNQQTRQQQTQQQQNNQQPKQQSQQPNQQQQPKQNNNGKSKQQSKK